MWIDNSKLIIYLYCSQRGYMIHTVVSLSLWCLCHCHLLYIYYNDRNKSSDKWTQSSGSSAVRNNLFIIHITSTSTITVMHKLKNKRQHGYSKILIKDVECKHAASILHNINYWFHWNHLLIKIKLTGLLLIFFWTNTGS